MKKLTFLSGIAIITGLLSFSTRALAQITLDSTDLPHAGLTVVIDSDGGPAFPQPGVTNTVTAQSWDFSGLLRQKSKTDIFMAASATPYASIFTPAADLADSAIGGNGYNFYSASAANFAVEGAEEIESVDGDVFQIAVNLNPVFEQSPLPASIGMSSTTSGIARGSQTFNESLLVFTQERFSTTIIYSDTVDAYGTMQMPNGETYPVLRQKHHEVDIDSALGYDGSWVDIENIITNKNQYDWYAKGVGYILAEMDMSTTFDTIVDVEWDTTAPPPLPSSINELSINSNVHVFPNPANNSITFSATNVADANEYIFIYDITGRQIDQVAIKNGIYNLNTTIYNDGVYLYKLTDSSGNLIDRGKFVVQH